MDDGPEQTLAASFEIDLLVIATTIHGGRSQTPSGDFTSITKYPMNRRKFIKQLGLGLGGLGFWSSFLPHHLAAKLPKNIKIIDLKAWAVGIEANQVFVKIYTNEGVTGLGEASVHRKTGTTLAACLELKDVLMGHDPTRIEFLWQGMFRWPRWRGGPVLNTAISAVEIALWDILGKLLDVPIYNLPNCAMRPVPILILRRMPIPN